MTIAILATGDEIINGDTLNTNGYEIAHTLSSEGIFLGLHLACSDQEDDLVESMEFLSRKHNILIIIGGLGPTSDDRTRFAFARFINTPLVEMQTALDHVQVRLSRAGFSLNQGNRQQALFPSNSTLLKNPYGTACGCFYSRQNNHFFLLPGPAVECLPMFRAYVLPILRQQSSDNCLLKWRLFGVSEGAIAEQLDEALRPLSCVTGYRLERPYLEFKVRCLPADVTQVKQIIDPLVADYIIASPEQKASEHLQERIEQLKLMINIHDEATGGVLQTLLQRPSNHAWLTFNGERNTTFFHITGLDEYWLQKKKINKTKITLHYRFGKTKGTEVHAFPYYSLWVVHAAAEWLCFRMGQLLTQFGLNLAKQ